MKGWLIFYTFKFCILPYLIKYIYWISPLERHHKIEKNKIVITFKNSLYREHYHLKRICKFACNYSCKFHEPSLSSSVMVSLIFSFVFSGQSLPWILHCTFWFHILEGKFSNSFLYFLLIYILFRLKKKHLNL